MTAKLGRDLFLESMRVNGIRYLFGNPGSTELPLIDALPNYPEIEYILALTEDAAVAMATGHAQVTEIPAVVNLHVYPGLAHGMGNMFTAYKNNVPLVVTAGQQDTRLMITEPPLYGDLLALGSNYTKWAWELKTADEIPLVMYRAIKVAITPPEGPVFLSLPCDLLMAPASTSVLPTPTMGKRVRADQEEIQKASNILASAKDPVMVVGDSIASARAVPDAIALAELIGARVYSEPICSRMNFPTTHPNWAGILAPSTPVIRRRLGDTDCIFFVGMRNFATFLYFPEALIPLSARVLVLHPDPWEVGRNFPIEAGLVGCPRATLPELHEAVEVSMTRENRAAADQRNEVRKAAYQEDKAQRKTALEKVWDKNPIAPLRVVAEMAAVFPRDALIVDEAATNSYFLRANYPFSEPNTLMGNKSSGLGYGLSAAVGAKLGCPERKVICCVGDGSALYYIQGLWSGARYRTPVVWIVFNNASYMTMKSGFLSINGVSAKRGIFTGADLDDPMPDFVKLAEGCGIAARRVTENRELRSALEWACDLNEPVLLDIHVDRSVQSMLG